MSILLWWLPAVAVCIVAAWLLRPRADGPARPGRRELRRLARVLDGRGPAR